jgi:hypothetical protein
LLSLSPRTPFQALLDAWYGLWPLVFQPAIGALMAGAVSVMEEMRAMGETSLLHFPQSSTPSPSHSLSLITHPQLISGGLGWLRSKQEE